MNYHFQMSRALLKVDNILDRKKIIEKSRGRVGKNRIRVKFRLGECGYLWFKLWKGIMIKKLNEDISLE